MPLGLAMKTQPKKTNWINKHIWITRCIYNAQWTFLGSLGHTKTTQTKWKIIKVLSTGKGSLLGILLRWFLKRGGVKITLYFLKWLDSNNACIMFSMEYYYKGQFSWPEYVQYSWRIFLCLQCDKRILFLSSMGLKISNEL